MDEQNSSDQAPNMSPMVTMLLTLSSVMDETAKKLMYVREHVQDRVYEDIENKIRNRATDRLHKTLTYHALVSAEIIGAAKIVLEEVEADWDFYTSKQYENKEQDVQNA